MTPGGSVQPRPALAEPPSPGDPRAPGLRLALSAESWEQVRPVRQLAHHLDGILAFLHDVPMPRNLDAHARFAGGLQAVREALHQRLGAGAAPAQARPRRPAVVSMARVCPPERAAEDGRIPDDLPLRETPRDRSPDAPDVPRSQRTEWNVRDSDATLILRPEAGGAADPGTDHTARCAARYGRPLLLCDPAAADAAATIRRWLLGLPISTLNVAGPSEATSPGIGAKVTSLLEVVFAGVQ